jgi:predicted ATPase
MDNFRGFTDTVIPLRDVNFLVGENSTGKTSFLKLMELLSAQEFPFFGISPRTSTLFGSFEDHVSVESKIRDYFVIGWIDHQSNIESNNCKVSSYFIMMFREREAIPYIYALRYFDETTEITLVTGSQNKDKWRPVFYSEENIEENLYHEVTKRINDFIVRFRTDSSDLSKKQDLNEFSLKDLKLKSLFTSHSEPLLLSLFLIRRSIQIFGGKQTYWSAPIRSKPLRTYEEPVTASKEEGLHTPYALRSILNSKDESLSFAETIRNFGTLSGLFRDVSVQDFGEGRFAVNIILTHKPLNLINVGYGVSQILPIIVEMIRGTKGTIFGVQQPEVHLHPKAQAALGELIFEFATTPKKHRYLIETHSEFLLDRFRLALKQSRKHCDAQVIHFERKAGKNIAHPLVIDKKGRYPEGEPTKSFRRFFLNEAISMLDI